jgi:hypothetical protein
MYDNTEYAGDAEDYLYSEKCLSEPLLMNILPSEIVFSANQQNPKLK